MSRRKYVERILNISLRVGVFDWARRFMPNVLTILNYHRVAERVEDFAFKPNISADVASFTRQMEYLKKNYNVISSFRLAAWLRGDEELSPHAALITFDDGYSDNYSVAYPILKKYELPATIFLATNYIGNNTPFPWDYAAYCFFLTEKTSAHLPAVGFASWKDRTDRERVMKRWVNRVKRFPNEEKSRALKELSLALDAVVPKDAFDGLYLTWDQVRELAGNGIAMGAHTASHPILTSIPLQSAREELEISKKKIEAETGLPVESFAYPNGLNDDFSPAIVELVREAGFATAFTLITGPTRRKSVRKYPHTIRRIFIDRFDAFPRFLAKLVGLHRVSHVLSGRTT